MTQQFDTIVIGAGGMGSAAAYYLSKAGQRVLLLEQFELDHSKGSSYGDSRVIRYAYNSPVYINLMRAAYPLWFALEEAAGEGLYCKTGGLEIGFPDQPHFQSLRDSMDQAALPYEYLNAQEMGDRFPQFRLDKGMAALYSDSTGMLAASRCVLAHTRLAQAQGATLLDRTPIHKIIPKDSSVEILTAAERYQAERLVITSGSWTKRLLAAQGIDLPLKVMPCQVAFFEPKQPEPKQPEPKQPIASELGRFPVFLFHLNGDYGEMPYGLPSWDSTGVKLSTFYGWKTVDHPDQVDYSPNAAWIEQMREFMQQYFPAANGRLLQTRRCLYTLTPDKHFVIDRHPEYPHIVFGAGFSGHGFKFATLIGSILTDLLLNGETANDISLFKLSRFQTSLLNL